jgi:glycosyltransferase involved in cell wall biosynthesis
MTVDSEMTLSVDTSDFSSPKVRSRSDHPTLEDARAAPPVSIIITTYNHARFLAEAIESALRQTVAAGEVIIVDDGSTDDPGSFARQYPQVRLIRQSNQGLAAARNTGWRAARGRYVVFLDADDRLMPDAIAANLRRFDERPECAFVYGSFCYIDSAGELLNLPAFTKIVEEDAYVSLLEGNCIGMHATVMYRRDCLEQAGGFDPQLRVAEDYELYLRLVRRYRIKGGAECIAAYRRHDTNMSRDIPLMLDTTLAVLRRQLPYATGSRAWQRAFKTGIYNWKTYYVKAQLSQARDIARTSGLKQAPLRAVVKIFLMAPLEFLRISTRRVSAALLSRLAPIRRKPVAFGDLRRLQPISRNFGYDRGKPVDRHYIEGFLSRNAADIRGRVLEIGDNAYTVQYGGTRVTSSDILHVDRSNPRATLIGDLTAGHDLPSEAFDCIILTQTLQFIFDMSKALTTVHRMLKPDGVLLLTVPGVSCIEREPNWSPLWTLSPTALRRLLAERFDGASIGVTTYGNVLAAVAFLHGLAEGELRAKELDAQDPQYPVIVAARAVKR